MKLHIVGKGVVGTATGEGFRKWGHEVVYSDKGDDHAAIAADLHFVCTPEEVAPEVVRQLGHALHRMPGKTATPVSDQGGIVIRSTVPPGTTARLSKEVRLPLLHNPEFLREKTAQEDFLTRPYAIVGSETYFGRPSRLENLKSLYRSGGVQCHVTDSTTSELVKLLTNAHLATLISFWNSAAAVSRRFGSNPYEVARLVGLDPRVSPYGRAFLESPYGGTCLPKDMAQLISAWEEKGPNEDLPPEAILLRAVQRVNQIAGGT